jgi:hypothetical protein
MSSPRAEKYCYECASVLPRAAPTCWSCSAPQPALPGSALADAPRPPASERDCAACGRRILVRAEICVHCGVRQPAETPPPAPVPGRPSEWDVSHALLALGVVLCVAVLLSGLRVPGGGPATSASVVPFLGTPPPPPSEATEAEAWATARRLVTTELRAPPNVAFPSEHETKRLGRNRFEVSSYFEMANTSGALVRTSWLIVIVRRGESWQIERLEAKN